MMQNARAQNERPKFTMQVITPSVLNEFEAFKNVTIPKGDFDPGGNYTHFYRIWLTGMLGQNYRGYIKIERKESKGDKPFNLHIIQKSVLNNHLAVHETNANLECLLDVISTPVSWNTETRLIDILKKEDFNNVRTKKSVIVKGREMEISINGRTYAQKVPSVYTSNWSLLDAVQRLSGPGNAPLNFALFDELDKLKENHTLSFRKKTTIPFGNDKVSVYCYQQIGRGLLPYEYYVDENHRLLLAKSGKRAYILDPNVEAIHKKYVSAALKNKKG